MSLTDYFIYMFSVQIYSYSPTRPGDDSEGEKKLYLKNLCVHKSD